MSEKQTRYILHHPEMGIYLGSCMGMGFWSKLDPVGQSEAATFDNPEQIKEFMATWENKVTGCEITPIETDCRDAYVTIAEIEAIGLPGWES
jgi:hypothetical protein